MEIDKKSWHFRLVKTFFSQDAFVMEMCGTDSCTYKNAVLRSLFGAFIICLSAFFVVYGLIIDPILFLTAPEYSVFNCMFVVAFLFAGVVAAVFIISIYALERVRDGVLREYISTIKNKMCVPVKIVDNDEKEKSDV